MGFSSHTESRLWLVAGLLLPIWNRLPGENMRVRRLATDAGESLLGRVLTPEQAHAFRDAFGLADGPVMSPAEMHEAILIRGASSHEGSGGTLRRVAERHHASAQQPDDRAGLRHQLLHLENTLMGARGSLDDVIIAIMDANDAVI